MSNGRQSIPVSLPPELLFPVLTGLLKMVSSDHGRKRSDTEPGSSFAKNACGVSTNKLIRKRERMSRNGWIESGARDLDTVITGLGSG